MLELITVVSEMEEALHNSNFGNAWKLKLVASKEKHWVIDSIESGGFVVWARVSQNMPQHSIDLWKLGDGL